MIARYMAHVSVGMSVKCRYICRLCGRLTVAVWQLLPSTRDCGVQWLTFINVLIDRSVMNKAAAAAAAALGRPGTDTWCVCGGGVC